MSDDKEAFEGFTNMFGAHERLVGPEMHQAMVAQQQEMLRDTQAHTADTKAKAAVRGALLPGVMGLSFAVCAVSIGSVVPVLVFVWRTLL